MKWHPRVSCVLLTNWYGQIVYNQLKGNPNAASLLVWVPVMKQPLQQWVRLIHLALSGLFSGSLVALCHLFLKSVRCKVRCVFVLYFSFLSTIDNQDDLHFTS